MFDSDADNDSMKHSTEISQESGVIGKPEASGWEEGNGEELMYDNFRFWVFEGVRGRGGGGLMIRLR
jgi:hypothetical protein